MGSDILSRELFLSRYLENAHCVTHIHSSLEIVLTVSGTTGAFLNGKNYEVPAGSAFFFEPFESHAFLNGYENTSCIIEFLPESKTFFWNYLQSRHIEDSERILPLPEETLRYLLAKLTDSLMEVTEENDPSYALAQTILMSLCYEFMTRCKAEKYADASDGTYTRTLKMISQMISENPQQDLSMNTTAKRLGMHRSTLQRFFSRNVHISYNDYLNYIRVCHAEKHLTHHMTVADAAYESGFHSMRTFNRVFRQVTGCTPTEYLAAADRQLYSYYRLKA